MDLGRFVCSLLAAVMVSGGALLSMQAEAAATAGGPAKDHTTHASDMPNCPTVDFAPAAGAASEQTAASDCDYTVGTDAGWVAGHCALCSALPAMPLTAIDDRQSGNVASATLPYWPGRCTAPDTPPRIG